MSTELEFRHDLSNLRRLPPIKVSRSQQTSLSDHNNNVIQVAELISEDRNDECRTPTSEESKIPTILSCPPPPRKRPRKAFSCRRNLTAEMEFFEVVNREEVDAFFRKGFDEINASVKRSCCQCK